ncbi:TolC family protein, partial [bacterium]|nr:TolC family protein [bacterium]
MKLFTRLAMATGLFALLGGGQVAGSDLDGLIQEALKHNPMVLASKEKWEAVRAKISTARVWPDPRLGISFEKNPGVLYSLGEARMRMVSISQTIPFPGKLSLRREMFTRDAQKASWEYEAIRQEVIAQVKSVYYDLFVLQRSVQLLQEQVDLLRAFERTTQVKYSVGQASQHDVLKAQVELALLREGLQTLRGEDQTTALARLNTILDRPANSPLAIPDEI